MTASLIQIVIDTCDAPHAFDGEGGIPPVVASLKSVDQYPRLHFAAPVILCVEQEAARARGAFLVSGDRDGRVIAFDPAGTAKNRRALAGSSNCSVAVLEPGSLFKAGGCAETLPDPDIPLMPASLAGVWVPEPNMWAERCGTTFGDE